MKNQISLFLIATCIFVTLNVTAQSDFIRNGSTGFEVGYGIALIKPENLSAFGLSISVDGTVDLGWQISVPAQSSPEFLLGFGIYSQDKPGKIALAFHSGYLIRQGKNYLVLAPSVYYLSKGSGVVVSPHFTFSFATIEGSFPVYSLGLNIATPGKLGFVLRPQYNILKNNSHLAIGIGLLIR